MKVYSSISGLVLAGGLSSRMGTDKAWLEIAGKPLYRHMVNILERAGLNSIMVSGKGPGGVVDQIPGKGPLSGIHAASSVVGHPSALLIVPVDMPLLRADLVRELSNQGVRKDIPLCYQGYMLPLFLPLNDRSQAIINESIASTNHKDYSLYRLHQRLKGETMPVPEGTERFFRNANTPDEWAHCLSESVSIESWK